MRYNGLMEFLKFNKGGQWELVKRNPEYADSPDMDMMSYRSRALDGRLSEDHGQRGVLHNNGNNRPPRQTSKPRMEGEVPTPIKSANRDRSPGLF